MEDVPEFFCLKAREQVPRVCNMPLRIQLSRIKGYRLSPNTVVAARPSKWGNPFVPGKPIPMLPGRTVADKRHAASLYHGFAPLNDALVAEAKAELAGKNLGCWCRLCAIHAAGKPLGVRCPDCEPCHVDTLLEIANRQPPMPYEEDPCRE
jgi:hypothetical protein